MESNLDLVAIIKTATKTNKRVQAKVLSLLEDILINTQYYDGPNGVRKVVLDALNDSNRNWAKAIVGDIEK
jgi:hypothetical protein